MVVEKGGPALVVRSARAGKSFPVFTDRARGEANVELEPEFLCDSPFTPGLHNEFVVRNRSPQVCRKWL